MISQAWIARAVINLLSCSVEEAQAVAAEIANLGIPLDGYPEDPDTRQRFDRAARRLLDAIRAEGGGRP